MLQANERDLVEDFRAIVTETDIGVAAQNVVYVHPTLLGPWMRNVLDKVFQSLLTRLEVPQAFVVGIQIVDGADDDRPQGTDGSDEGAEGNPGRLSRMDWEAQKAAEAEAE